MFRRAPLSASFDLTVLAAELPPWTVDACGRYRGFELLAEGGKAEIFGCTDALLGRQVVLKVLHRRLMDSAIEQRMLVREARTMAALAHPSIPEVYDLGRDQEGRPYFAMALKAGPTLHDLLSRLRHRDAAAVRDFPLERLLDVLLRVGATLDYAHGMNVVHCDLKPENIILGSGELVSVLDWGLAVVDDYSAAAGANPAIEERGRQGSALYMSPEQAAGKLRLGPASDIYGLGVLLYECLTLDTPCRGATAAETMRNVLDKAPVAPRTIAFGRRVPRDLERTCLRALAKSPGERFESMEEFCEEIDDCRTELLINFEREEPQLLATLPPRTVGLADDCDRATRRYGAARGCHSG